MWFRTTARKRTGRCIDYTMLFLGVNVCMQKVQNILTDVQCLQDNERALKKPLLIYATPTLGLNSDTDGDSVLHSHCTLCPAVDWRPI